MTQSKKRHINGQNLGETPHLSPFLDTLKIHPSNKPILGLNGQKKNKNHF